MNEKIYLKIMNYFTNIYSKILLGGGNFCSFSGHIIYHTLTSKITIYDASTSKNCLRMIFYAKKRLICVKKWL